MYILGISAYHGDSAAALIKDNTVVAAVEEERITRIKHWAGFPAEAIKTCLATENIKIDHIDYIAVNRAPNVNFVKKVIFAIDPRVDKKFILDRINSRERIIGIHESVAKVFNCSPAALAEKTVNVEHHIAHAASAYHCSPFEESAIITVDGFGDWSSSLLAGGSGNRIEEFKRVFYPHSLGVLYTAITQFLGFWNYGDEYKVMGMAPYGNARFVDKIGELIAGDSKGGFTLNRKYFTHFTGMLEMKWKGGAPEIGPLFTPQLESLLGPARQRNEEVSQQHKDIAASLQAGYEQIFSSQLTALYEEYPSENLCIAGGCGMNSVANGKARVSGPFKNIYIPPQPGDAGGAVGAGLFCYYTKTDSQRSIKVANPYLGPAFDTTEIRTVLEKDIDSDAGFEIMHIEDPDKLCPRVAADIASGKVVGWFQGRMEWGPRALGNRSILADPRRPDMKDILNIKIKKRETFRPFAPSILREHVADYFEVDCSVPYMSSVFQIKADKRPGLPAVTHVNGSGRLQSVSRSDNPLYWRLIKSFYDQTGVPIVLNTSFNENEPIVCTPQEAVACFLRTQMDTLAIGNFYITRQV